MTTIFQDAASAKYQRSSKSQVVACADLVARSVKHYGDDENNSEQKLCVSGVGCIFQTDNWMTEREK